MLLSWVHLSHKNGSSPITGTLYRTQQKTNVKYEQSKLQLWESIWYNGDI